MMVFGGDRGLATAAGALIGPGLGSQPPGIAPTAARADKPVWPARCDKICRAGGFVAETLLELAAADRVVLACLSDGHPLQCHLGLAAATPTRFGLIQDGFAALRQAAPQHAGP